jgi:hypothetical protein
MSQATEIQAEINLKKKDIPLEDIELVVMRGLKLSILVSISTI